MTEKLRVFLLRVGGCLFLAFVANVLLIDHAHAQCDPGDTLVSQRQVGNAIEYTCIRTAWIAPRSTLCDAQLRVRADQDAIRALNFRASVETFEYFQTLSEEQKREFESKALTEMIDAGLDVSSLAFDRMSSLNPFNVNTAINRLRSTGLEDPALFSAMRRVAASRGKPELAREYEDLIEQIDNTRNIHDAQTATDNQALRWALAVLHIAQQNPYADLAVTTVEFGESAAYLYYLTQQTGELTRQTESNLTLLNTLTGRLRQHVAELRDARARWRAVAGASDPRCA